jgi:methionyl-tRNA synthetase
MKYDKYISTTLPYANSVPHIGHSLEFIQADALVKYFKRVQSEDVFFNVGLDENGLKVHTKAKELGVDTQDYLNSLCLDWTAFCTKFQIEPDNFYRTSRKAHYDLVQQFWTESLERGDIYKKKYTGQYCVGCESFKTSADLVDGKCPDHGTVPETVEEENYFFRVEKYKTAVFGWLQYHKTQSPFQTVENEKTFLKPRSKTAELENIILSSEDISISRLKKNVPWGVPVPNDPDQVIYVWFDALLNYIFAVSDFDEQTFIQICGPDNLKFQGSLFQSILESANHKHTTKLLVHGTILDEQGRKMSKTLGNVIDPIDQLNKYGLDAVRYYTLAGLSTYGDGCWSEKDLVQLYNTELADDFGNLISRTLHLIDTKDVEINLLFNKGEYNLDPYVTAVFDKIKGVKELWIDFEINQALKETNSILKLANKYINDTAPWKEGNEYVRVLNNLFFTLKEVNKLYSPILSKETSDQIKDALIQKKKVIIFKKIEQ